MINNKNLPSNKKFGYFFSLIFAILALYFFAIYSLQLSYVFTFLAVLFILITVCKSNLLLPLNILWMHLGVSLGVIINPIVLGIIFFLLFTPLAFMMRIFQRDALRLKLKKRGSHWIEIKTKMLSNFFHNQF